MKKTQIIEDSCIGHLACPECGYRDGFVIAYSTMGVFSHDGEIEQTGHQEWDDASYCRCTDCGHNGTVKNFTIRHKRAKS